MDLKEQCREELSSIAQDIQKLGKALHDEIAIDLGAASLEYTLHKMGEISEQIEKNYKRLNQVRGIMGDVYDYEYYPVTPSLAIKREGKAYQFKLNQDRAYHLILDERLPHRITIDKYANRLKYEYDPNIYYSGYRRAVEEWLKNNQVDISKDKVLLLIITHGPEKNMLDNDNIELKTFIDAAIKGIFVKDDAPVNLALMLDFVIDQKEYTEMYISEYTQNINI